MKTKCICGNRLRPTSESPDEIVVESCGHCCERFAALESGMEADGSDYNPDLDEFVPEEAEGAWRCHDCRYRGPGCHNSDYGDDEIRCPNCGCPDGDGFGPVANEPEGEPNAERK